MKKYWKAIISVVLVAGLAACSSDGGGKKRGKKGDPNDPSAAPSATASEADQKYDQLKTYQLNNANLKILADDGTVFDLGFELLSDAQLVATLSGAMARDEVKENALSDGRPNGYRADVKNIDREKTINPSLFYVLNKTPGQRAMDLFVFVYTSNKSPINVVGPVRVSPRVGLSVFDAEVGAYADAGLDYYAFLKEMVEFFANNPEANYRQYRDYIAEERFEGAEPPTNPNAPDRVEECDADCEFQQRNRENNSRIDERGRIIRDSRDQNSHSVRHPVRLIEDSNGRIGHTEPADVWNEIPPTINGFHTVEQCMHPQVKMYNAMSSGLIRVHRGRDDSSPEFLGLDGCTKKIRDNVIENIEDGELTAKGRRRNSNQAACVPHPTLIGGFTRCRIQEFHPAPAAATPRPQQRPIRSSRVESVKITCGSGQGTSFSVKRKEVTVGDRSICLNRRPYNPVKAIMFATGAAKVIPGVNSLNVGLGIDFSKTRTASKFVRFATWNKSTSSGTKITDGAAQATNLDDGRTSFTMPFFFTNHADESLGSMQFGCTVKKQYHSCPSRN